MGEDAVEQTPDGRYVVVGGRRWRASDPGIPDALRAELVAELMAARRAVRERGDAARPRVHDAKVALGERGEPWWEWIDAGRRARIAATVRTLLRHRSSESSICPSDVARVAGGTSWRQLMQPAREVAAEMVESDLVVVTQRGSVVDPLDVSGPIRISRGSRWPDDDSTETA